MNSLIFRTVLALAGAGVIAVIPGFIEIQISNWLRAGGALAGFVVLYFWNPALPADTAPVQAGPSTTTLQTNVGPNGIIINNSGTGIQSNNIGKFGDKSQK